MTEWHRIRYLSPREVGEIVGRSEDTIRRLIRKNAIKGVRLPSSTHYAILPSEVLRLSREYDIPITEEDRKVLEEYQATEPKGIG